MKNGKFQLKNLDMYGQNLRFSNFGKYSFSSGCGCCVSLIILGLFILYSIMLCISTFSLTYPVSSREIYGVRDEKTAFNLIPDLASIFNTTQPIALTPDIDTDTVQFSIGLFYNNKPSAIDPRYFQMNVLYYYNDKVLKKYSQMQMLFDRCKRFEGASNYQYDYYQLSYSYCIYSPVTVRGNPGNEIFSNLKIELSQCSNGTAVYINRTDMVEYYRLKYLYETTLKKNSTVTYKIFDDFNKILNDDLANARANFNESEFNVRFNLTNSTGSSNSTIPGTNSTGSTNSTGGNSTVKPLKSDNTLEKSKFPEFETFNPYTVSIKFLNSSMGMPVINYFKPNNTIKFITRPSEDYFYQVLKDNNIDPRKITVEFIRQNVTSFKPVICLPSEEIINKIRETQINTYYLSKDFNNTSPDALSKIVKTQKSYGSNLLKKTSRFNLEILNLISYDTILPRFISKSNINSTFINFDIDEERFNSIDNSNPVFYTIEFYYSNIIRTFIRSYGDILNVLFMIGGFWKVLFTVGFVLVYFIVNFKFNVHLINQFYSVIMPYRNKDILKKFDKYLEDRLIGIKEKKLNAMEEYFDDDLIRKISEMEFIEKRKYEIIYEAYKYQVFSKLEYNLCERLLNCCCSYGSIRLKNKIFNKAKNKLEKDLDLLTIKNSIQEFENMMPFFLDEGQSNLFSSIVHKEITSDIAENKLHRINAKKRKITEFDKKKKSKNFRNNYVSDEDKEKSIKNRIYHNYSLVKEMENLKGCLDVMFNKNGTLDDMDKKILENLIEDKDIVKSLISEVEKIQKENVKNILVESEVVIMDPNQTPMTKADIEKINKKIGKL